MVSQLYTGTLEWNKHASPILVWEPFALAVLLLTKKWEMWCNALEGYFGFLKIFLMIL